MSGSPTVADIFGLEPIYLLLDDGAEESRNLSAASNEQPEIDSLSETARLPAMDDTNSPFTSASPDDIVLGKGNGIKNHKGNKDLRAIVCAYSWEYDDTPKARKREFAADLAFTILHGPTVARRVLESVDGTVDCCTVVQNDDAIVEVVMHRLRNGRKARAEISKTSRVEAEMTGEDMAEALDFFLG